MPSTAVNRAIIIKSTPISAAIPTVNKITNFHTFTTFTRTEKSETFFVH